MGRGHSPSHDLRRASPLKEGAKASFAKFQFGEGVDLHEKVYQQSKKQVSIGVTIFIPFPHDRWLHFVQPCHYAPFGVFIYCRCYSHVCHKSLSALRSVFQRVILV